MDSQTSKANLEYCANLINACRLEAAKRVVGQKHIIDGILMALISGGHILLEGVPGLAKTLSVKTFAELSGLDFKRIQFTPDLLPADVTGTLIYEQQSGRFSVRRGPVFTNIVLADEINRAPAKVQSALLEAMAEHQVTIGEDTHSLPDPFFVLATQNPIEQEGTYNLPEAELDRFLLKLIADYPSVEEEISILRANSVDEPAEIKRVFDAQALKRCREATESITADDKILAYIVSLVNVTRPKADDMSEKKLSLSASNRKNDIRHYISFGASPRACIALLKCAKVNALFNGRSFVLPEDVQQVAHGVLRHRLVLNYEAAADGVTSDSLISKIIELLPLP